MKWLCIEQNLGTKAGKTERVIFEMPKQDFQALEHLSSVLDHMSEWLAVCKADNPELTHTVELRIMLSLSEGKPSKVCLQAASANHVTTQKPERAGLHSSSACEPS